MNKKGQVNKKAAQAGGDGIFQNPREVSECQDREWTHLLGLAVEGVVVVRPRAGDRGLLMALLKPWTLSQWTVGSL